MHDGHHIKVLNSWFTGEKLYVNGQLQDENLGLAEKRNEVVKKWVILFINKRAIFLNL